MIAAKSVVYHLQYYAPQWEVYVEECSIFSVSISSLPHGSTGEAEGEAGGPTSTPAPSSDAEGEATPAPTTTSDAEAAASPSPAEAAAEASPSPAEAEASPSPAEAEAAPPADTAAPTDAEAEAANGRRRLLDAAEAGAGQSTGSGICFPSFQTTEEFEMYLNGEYFTEVYEAPSDTAGIILSVFFWVGLASMGLYLRH